MYLIRLNSQQESPASGSFALWVSIGTNRDKLRCGRTESHDQFVTLVQTKQTAPQQAVVTCANCAFLIVILPSLLSSMSTPYLDCCAPLRTICSTHNILDEANVMTYTRQHVLQLSVYLCRFLTSPLKDPPCLQPVQVFSHVFCSR